MDKKLKKEMNAELSEMAFEKWSQLKKQKIDMEPLFLISDDPEKTYKMVKL